MDDSSVSKCFLSIRFASDNTCLHRSLHVLLAPSIVNSISGYVASLYVSILGKIKSGLKVKYRLSAFPFFEYKGAEGIITAVDPDIRSGNNGLLYYIVYADLDRVVFKNRHGDSFPVRSGLETDARIVLETESIIYYILRKIDFLY